MDDQHGQHPGPGAAGAQGSGSGAAATAAPPGPSGDQAASAAVVAAADPEVGALLSLSTAIEQLARNSRARAAAAALEVVALLDQVPASARPTVREAIATLDGLAPEPRARVMEWMRSRYGGGS